MYTNTPPAPESDAVNVLLLDSLNTPKQDQSRVHLEIIDFFKKMQPGTRVAIFMLGSQLRFLQGFTTDTSVLLAKLKGTEPQKDSSFHDRSDQADDAADAQRLAMMMGSFAGAGSTAGAGARAAAQAEVANVGYGERASMTFGKLSTTSHAIWQEFRDAKTSSGFQAPSRLSSFPTCRSARSWQTCTAISAKSKGPPTSSQSPRLLSIPSALKA